VNTKDEELTFLAKRVTELEKQIDNLRLSRRILMDLLEQIEKEKNILISQLENKAKIMQKQKKAAFRKMYSQSFELYEFNNYKKQP